MHTGLHEILVAQPRDVNVARLFRASWSALIFLLAGCTEPPERAETWPTRPIQITCFTSPGGGTDTISRTFAQALEPLLGVRIHVVNLEGARGGRALRDVWSRKHDGYRWGGFSEAIVAAPVMNAHHTTSKNWTYFLAAGAPGVLSVAANSPYLSLKEVVEEAKKHPGTINAAASNIGGIWHTKLVILERAADVSFNYIPYSGSNPSQLALLSGEVDLALTSISEQAELIKSKQVRPLAMIEPEPFDMPGGSTIPSASEEYSEIGKFLLQQWLGFALPRDVPQEVLETVGRAFETAMQSDGIRTLLRARFLSPYGLTGEAANQVVSEMERQWTWLLHDLGIAERSPEVLGIPRP